MADPESFCQGSSKDRQEPSFTLYGLRPPVSCLPISSGGTENNTENKRRPSSISPYIQNRATASQLYHHSNRFVSTKYTRTQYKIHTKIRTGFHENKIAKLHGCSLKMYKTFSLFFSLMKLFLSMRPCYRQTIESKKNPSWMKRKKHNSSDELPISKHLQRNEKSHQFLLTSCPIPFYRTICPSHGFATSFFLFSDLTD